MARTCTVPSCPNLLMARGYCMTHYARWRTHGDVHADIIVREKGTPKPRCLVTGCPNHARLHGYCGGHAKRLRTTGDVHDAVPLRKAAAKGMPLAERLWSMVDQSGGPDACWPFLGRTQKGYGSIRIEGHNVRVHRLAYTLTYGPVPEDMILDHQCHTNACTLGDHCPHRRCCNPAHLAPATHRENVLRGARVLLQGQCKRGHPYDENNTHIKPNGDRRCKTCHRLYNKSGVPS